MKINKNIIYYVSKNIKKNESGQALLFVVVTMTIALAVGVGASLRSISSIRRVANTDTYSRVLSAAEGGIERFLALSYQELIAASSGTCPSANDIETLVDPQSGKSYCVVRFDPINSLTNPFGFGNNLADNITAVARVEVSPITNIAPGESLRVNLPKEDTLELRLEGYNPSGTKTLGICWTPKNPSVQSALYLVGYSTSDFFKMGVGPSSLNELPTGFSTNANSNNCFRADLSKPANIYGLRIMSMFGDSIVEVFPIGANLPIQGHQVTSVGVLLNNNDIQSILNLDFSSGYTSQSLSVGITAPYLPSVFNFGIFSRNGDVLNQ